MNQEFSLDSLKEAWKNQAEEKKYSSDEIFKMLKRKSTSSVKWVFIISVIELLLTVIAYIIMFTNLSIIDYHEELMESMGYWGIVYEILSFFVYGVTFLFIYLFFKSYRSIRVQSSIKALSLDIISFRRLVNYFIYFNLIMAFILMWLALIPMFSTNPELSNIEWTSSTGIGIIVGITVAFLAFIGLFWLYYFIVYGTFLRRLRRNLKELDGLE